MMTRAKARQPAAFAPAIILIGGLAMTCLLTWQAQRLVKARSAERFDAVVNQAKSDLRACLDLYTQTLRGGAALYAADATVDAASFGRYFDRVDLPLRAPALKGVGFVQASEGAASLSHLTPERSLRINVATDGRAEEAMLRAATTGAPAVTAPLENIGEAAPATGFAIFLPVYAGGVVPGSEQARVEKLVGYVLGVVEAGAFFRHAAELQTLQLANFDVLDADANQLRLYAPELALDDAPFTGTPFVQSISIDAGGRHWKVGLSSRPEFEDVTGAMMAPVIAIGGLGCTAFLFWIMTTQSRSRLRAEQHAYELERSEADLRMGEARLRAILESALDAVILMDHRGVVTEWNPAAEKTFGYPRAEALGRSLADLIIPTYLHEHHYKSLENYARTGDGEDSRSGSSGTVIGRRFETMAVRADGSELPVEWSIVRIGADEPPTFTGFIRDITDRRRVEKHRELMARELDHRVKNNLSTVAALADQSAYSSTSFDDFVASFSGRLRALAQLHEMLAHNRWTGAELGDVVRGVMAVYLQDGPDRVQMDGEPVDLPDKVVSSLCLALHELATNAGKYGGLSVPGGQVHIRWEVARVDGERTLQVSWEERNGPPVVTPRRRGFGTELVERGLAYEIKAKTQIDFAPDGLRCEICIALPEEVVVQRRSRPVRMARR